MAEMRSAVVAGSKGFVDAVQDHIKMRFGAAPRVARDPAEALRACADGGDLLVLEYVGGPWLDAVKSLRSACGDGALSIVAAVPAAQASDVQPLQRVGVDEVVSWQGRVDPVLWAVDRVVGRQGAQEGGALQLVPQPSEEVQVDKGFELRESPATGAPAAPSPVPQSSPRATPLPVAPAPELLWPEAVPSAVAAEALLLSAAAGLPAGDAAQRASAERVLGAASELERAALAGTEIPIDPPLLRVAVATRLRLDIALSSVPIDADRVNQPAAQRLVADVDGVLGQLKALTAAAPAGVAPALEPVRLAIVDGGVKLAGALSRFVPLGAAQPVASSARQEQSTRLLSNEVEAAAKPRPRKGLGILLIAVAVLTATYHGWQYAQRKRPTPAPTLPGAPAHTVAVRSGGTRILVLEPGKKVDPAELESFRVLEQGKGNRVWELGKGTWIVEPDAAETGTNR